jgi:hypothetical protein
MDQVKVGLEVTVTDILENVSQHFVPAGEVSWLLRSSVSENHGKILGHGTLEL